MGRPRDPVAVIGLGRFGSALALELARQGNDVLAIDHRAEVVQRHASRLGRLMVADSTDLEALEECGLPEYSRAVVAIGADRQASILTTALLSELSIGDIWAKGLDDQHAKILTSVGAHHVIQPEHDMGERVAHLVCGGILDYIEVAPEWVLARANPPKDLVGVPLGRSRLRTLRRVTIVSVKPEHSENFVHADAETILGYGDQILIAGRPPDIERFIALI